MENISNNSNGENESNRNASQKQRKRIKIEDKLKRYEKIEFLGEGQVTIWTKSLIKNIQNVLFSQFATVYKSRDVEEDRIVAVKKVLSLYFIKFLHI